MYVDVKNPNAVTVESVKVAPVVVIAKTVKSVKAKKITKGGSDDCNYS